MPSPVIQIRIPKDELKAVRDEAEKRGIAPSLLMRYIVRDALSGPGAGSIGRIAASKAVIQKAKPVVQPVVQEFPPPVARPKSMDALFKRQPKASLATLSLSERMRQMRESAAG